MEMEKTKNIYSYPIKNARMLYKASPAHKGRLKHAVDFIVPEGTPVRAALGGVVVDVKQNSSKGGRSRSYDKHGNYIEIRHLHGEYSIYEHIKKNGSLVKKGQKVRKGQVIGFSGATGWIAHLGPHLHFDVHRYLGTEKNNYASLTIVWKKK